MGNIKHFSRLSTQMFITRMVRRQVALNSYSALILRLLRVTYTNNKFTHRRRGKVFRVKTTRVRLNFTLQAKRRYNSRINIITFSLTGRIIITATTLSIRARANARTSRFRRINASSTGITFTIRGQWQHGDFISHCTRRQVLNRPTLFTVNRLRLLVNRRSITTNAPTLNSIFSLTTQGHLRSHISSLRRLQVILICHRTRAINLIFARINRTSIIRVALISRMIHKGNITRGSINLVGDRHISYILVEQMVTSSYL